MTLIDQSQIRNTRRAVSNVDSTINLNDYIIAYTSLSAQRTVNLPTAASAVNRIFIVKDESGNAATFNIVIDPNSSETIDGASTKSITMNYMSLSFYSNGTAWFVY